MLFELGLLTSFEDQIKQRAIAEGFEAVGICGPDGIPLAATRLREFFADGHHGEMDWMLRRAEWRGNPQKLWPQVRSVIMLAESYAPECDPLEDLQNSERGYISVYARNRDYHDVVKKRLKRLGRWLVSETAAQIKVFVDTAPVMEKPLAEAAGIGWQGKHTNLVSRDLGNWFFLGAIFTTLLLSRDNPSEDHCGSCRRCLDICPTDAFPAPYQLDARRCISYLTIEFSGAVDEQFRPALGNRIFGCDDCLAVCPWNKFATAAQETHYQARDELRSPDLVSLAALSESEFRELFRGGPIKRIGRNRFVRNVLYALGNSKNTGALPTLAQLRSDDNAVVAEAAAWAEDRINSVSAVSE